MSFKITIFEKVERNKYPQNASIGREIEIQNLEELGGISKKYAFSPAIYHENKRKKENFLSARIIGLDFDEGHLKENIKRLKQMNLNFVVGATKNHQKSKNGKAPCDRYRILILLTVAIENKEKYEKTIKYFIEKLVGADAQCSDAARYFFSCESILYENYDAENFNPVNAISDEQSPSSKDSFDWTPCISHLYNDKPLAKGGIAFLDQAITGHPGTWNNNLYSTACSARINKWGKDEFIDVIRLVAPEDLDSNDIASINSAFKSDSKKNLMQDKRKQSELAVEIVLQDSILFESVDGEPFFKSKHDDPYVYSLKNPSEELRDIITEKYFNYFHKIITRKSIEELFGVLRFTAKRNKNREIVYERMAVIDNKFVYNSMNDSSFILIKAEVSETGYRFLKEKNQNLDDAYFLKSKEALPSPKLLGKQSKNYIEVFDRLYDLLNLKSTNSKILSTTFLVNVLTPISGDKPILAVGGEQGSGKTTFTSCVHRLIDNRTTILSNIPENEHELYIIAQGGIVVSFDNISNIKDKISDVLCKLSTGSTFVKRKMYNDNDKNVLSAKKSIIINGITATPQRADLLDRTLNLYFDPIEKKISKSELESCFDEIKDEVFTAILELVSIVLLRFKDFKSTSEFRMTDFVKVGCIVEEVLGYPRGTFVQAYSDSIHFNSANIIEEDPVGAGIILTFSQGEEFNGSATQLYERVKQTLRCEDRLKNFPRNAGSFSKRLKRIAPELRKHGYEICEIQRKAHLREISIKVSKTCTLFDLKIDSLEEDANFFHQNEVSMENSRG